MDVKNASAEKITFVQREKKVPERGFFSLSVLLRGSFSAVLFLSFLLCGCFFPENAKKTTQKILEEKSLSKITDIQNKRVLRFLLVEKGDFVLAYRAMMAAGEQLGLSVRVTWTFPEHISPMLRGDKADIAYDGGTKISAGELQKLMLEKYTLTLTENEKKKHHIPFIMNRGGRELWGNLEKAILSSSSNGGISFEMPENEEMEEEKMPVETKREVPEISGKKETKKIFRKAKFKKRSSKRERMRAKIIREVQKRKEAGK